MTAQQLIDELSKLPPETKLEFVMDVSEFASDSGFVFVPAKKLTILSDNERANLSWKTET